MQSFTNKLSSVATKLVNATIPFDWSYDWRTGTASIELIPTAVSPLASFSIIGMSNDMQTFFHCDEMVAIEPTSTTPGTIKYTFSNIWNRQFAFLHASFVTGTSFN